MMSLNISQEESVLSADIFRRLNGIPLVDPYEAYQLLDDEWAKSQLTSKCSRQRALMLSAVLTPT